MPLTGIEIFKMLPKTNCGECGVPTCLAFAMKLATGKAELAACPYVSEEAKAKLDTASAPPVRLITVGIGDQALKVGGETVMFRHEKRFENPPGLALLISDTMESAEIEARLERFKQFQYERVGLILRPELIAARADSGRADRYASLVDQVKQNNPGGIILMSDDPELLAAGLEVCADRKPLLYAATAENLDRLVDLAKANSCPVVAKASGLEKLAELTNKLTAAGVKDLVLDSEPGTMRQAFEDQVIIRSAALNKKFRPLGFPTIAFPGKLSADPLKEAVIAAALVAKYGGIIVLSDFQGHSLFPLLLARMNIYTDPQRPLATTEGIYKIGGPDEKAPVLLTCNFSLAYFIVSGEVEASKVPCYLLIKDTAGLSVLTAWASGKFGADTIGPFVKRCGISELIAHRKLIIPGYLAAERGELEEELSDWEILVGPREAAHLPAYLRTLIS